MKVGQESTLCNVVSVLVVPDIAVCRTELKIQTIIGQHHRTPLNGFERNGTN